jgi:uncharacterized protein
MPTRRAFLRGVLAATGAAAVGTAWWQWTNERHALTSRTVRLRPDGWRYGRVRIGFLADLHLRNPDETEFCVGAVRLLGSLNPDVVLIGGDYNTNSPIQSALLRTVMGEIRALGRPAAGILGNHDMDETSLRLTRAAFRDAAIPLLVNERADVGGLPVYGYDDCLYGKPVRRPEAADSAVHLLHEPDWIETAGRVPLVLSGHTHGGQICLPGGFPIHLPEGGKRFVEGLYEREETTLFVTRGLGTTGYWKRTFCRPEVVLLDVG